MKGRKGSTDEGGVRSPLLGPLARAHPARDAGHADRRRDRPAADAGRAGRGPRSSSGKPLDGASLAPLLLGEPRRLAGPDDLLALERQGQRAHAAISARRHRPTLRHGRRPRPDAATSPREQPEVAATARAGRRPLAEGSAYRPAGTTTGRSRSAIASSRSRTLPARDGVPHGNVSAAPARRTARTSPTGPSTDDRITWDVEVATSRPVRGRASTTPAPQRTSARRSS